MIARSGFPVRFLFAWMLLMGVLLCSGCSDAESSYPEITTTTTTTATETTTTTTTTRYPGAPNRTTHTTTIVPGELRGKQALLIDMDEEMILAECGSSEVLYPASLTKIISLIIVLDHISTAQFDTVVTMSDDVIAPLRAQMAACTGLQGGESATYSDLLYGMMLPSGADATVTLAIEACGSEAAFVAEMNQLAEEMGLTQTHFVNPTGLHDEAHQTTLLDLSRILTYALKNPIACQILSTREYHMPATEQHPEGLIFPHTMFMRMKGTEVPGMTILGGKTGFTDQAGQCLASWAQNEDGKQYLCIVAGCPDPMDVVYDSLNLYANIDRFGTGTVDLTQYQPEEETP